MSHSSLTAASSSHTNASTGQATSSTSNIQLIVNALADYAKITGIDLSRNSFAAALEQSNSPEAILQLLEGREKAFKEYRDGSRRLIRFLSPAVKVLQAFSGILGETVGPVTVSVAYYPAPCGSFNESALDPVPTSKLIVCWDRCTP
jgi:hypothetical protein